MVADSLIDYTDTFTDFDPVLSPVGPSNPWITDDQTFWLLNQPMQVSSSGSMEKLLLNHAVLTFCRVENPTENRVRKWKISLEDLVTDPQGKVE